MCVDVHIGGAKFSSASTVATAATMVKGWRIVRQCVARLCRLCRGGAEAFGSGRGVWGGWLAMGCIRKGCRAAAAMRAPLRFTVSLVCGGHQRISTSCGLGWSWGPDSRVRVGGRDGTGLASWDGAYGCVGGASVGVGQGLGLRVRVGHCASGGRPGRTAREARHKYGGAAKAGAGWARGAMGAAKYPI